MPWVGEEGQIPSVEILDICGQLSYYEGHFGALSSKFLDDNAITGLWSGTAFAC
jgi:hypothetical protein